MCRAINELKFLLKYKKKIICDELNTKYDCALNFDSNQIKGKYIQLKSKQKRQDKGKQTTIKDEMRF